MKKSLLILSSVIAFMAAGCNTTGSIAHVPPPVINQPASLHPPPQIQTTTQSKPPPPVSPPTNATASNEKQSGAVDSSGQPAPWKKYSNSEFGVVSFEYPADFTLSEQRYNKTESTQSASVRLAITLSRTGWYRFEYGQRSYTETITVKTYDKGKDWSEQYFTKDSPITIDGLPGWTAARSGSEQFMMAFVSTSSTTYVFQISSHKPTWLQGSEEQSSFGVFKKLLATVKFQ